MGLRFAVTGASGFVGRHLVRQASTFGHEVVGIVRNEAGAEAVKADGGRAVVVPALGGDELLPALAGCRAIVHLAQIGAERYGLTYDGVNVAGTAAVVAAARAAGVSRAVLFSGLGVASFGKKPRCTTRYFLSKLEAELAVYRSGLEAVVFRPSYIVGPGDAFVPALLRDLQGGVVERVGDGAYRLQPIAVRDAAELVLAALVRPSVPALRGGEVAAVVYDLVGPEAVAYQAFLERLAAVAREHGRSAKLEVREVKVAFAEEAARAGGWRGLGPDELDCVLCDEVSDPAPLEALLGRFLTPLDEALGRVVRSL